MKRKDILNKTFDKVVEYFGHYRDDDDVAFVDRDRFIEALYNEIGFHIWKPAWIPASKRLPNDDAMCLVTKKYVGENFDFTDQIEIDFWRADGKGSGKWLKFSSFWEVTAWMPLAEPYEENK